MSISKITTDDLRHMKDKEALILQGCGGDLQEWVDGVNQMLAEEGILLEGTVFSNCSFFEHGNLTCLLLPFEDVKLDVGKLAMWRLKTHAEEMKERIYSSHSYSEALNIIGEYVNITSEEEMAENMCQGESLQP